MKSFVTLFLAQFRVKLLPTRVLTHPPSFYTHLHRESAPTQGGSRSFFHRPLKRFFRLQGMRLNYFSDDTTSTAKGNIE